MVTRGILTAHFLLGLAAIAAGGLGLYVALLALDVRLWFLALFSGLSVVAGGFGLGLSFGGFRAGRAITALSLAGAIGAGAVLGWIQAAPNLAASPGWRQTLGIWVAVEVGVAVGLALVAAVDALARSPRGSLALLGRAAILSVPLAGLLVLGWWLYSGGGKTAAPDMARIIYAVIGSAGVLGLVSAVGHCVIRAFDLATGVGEPARPVAAQS